MIDLSAAHKHSKHNIKEIGQSKLCGCFFCLRNFLPVDVREFIKDDVDYTLILPAVTPERSTAICPYCGVDSVIADTSGFPVANVDFLEAMHDRWFGICLNPEE